MKTIVLVLYFVFNVAALPVNANDEQARIKAKHVNLRNYERFVAQLERDLPVGTSLQDVRAYLSENKIDCSETQARTTSFSRAFSRALGYLYENKIGCSETRNWPIEGCHHIQFMVKKIGNPFLSLIGFSTGLWIGIYISEADGLLEINSKLIHTSL